MTIQVVSASRVPAIFVENLSSEPLVVLGKDDEPFARIGPTITEVNVKSPAWAAMQQALGKTLDDEADATAEPKWQQIADAAQWQWLEFRAAAPETDPPQPIVERKTATTVRNWSVPYLVGGTAPHRRRHHPVRAHRRPAPSRPAGRSPSPMTVRTSPSTPASAWPWPSWGVAAGW